MSRIDDLIAEHCPDGVDFRTVGEASVPVSMPGQVRREEYGRGSTFPVVDQSVDFIAGYTDDPSLVVPKAEYVVFGDHTRAVKFVNFAFAQGADGVKVLQAAKGLTTKWLYYCISNLSVPRRGYNRHWTVLRELSIPVPPIVVQNQIIAILDTMRGLQAELEVELEYRSRQYAYYRDHLLAVSGGGAVPWMRMEEVGEFSRGRRFTKKDIVDEGIACINFGEIYTHYGPFADSARSRVRADLAPSLRFAQTGDVVIAAVSETVEDICKAVAWLGDEPVAVHDDCFMFRHTLNPKFVSYFLRTSGFHAEKAKYVARAKVKRISADSLGKLMIPVPPREEQDRIVEILDRFDALVNDLSIGLPAEIKARRRQYEHYRDRLLTFEEKVA